MKKAIFFLDLFKEQTRFLNTDPYAANSTFWGLYGLINSQKMKLERVQQVHLISCKGQFFSNIYFGKLLKTQFYSFLIHKITILLFALFVSSDILAQTANYLWINGYSSIYTDDSLMAKLSHAPFNENMILDSMVVPDYDQHDYKFFNSGTAVLTDTLGNLLLFSNGCSYYDRNSNHVEGSEAMAVYNASDCSQGYNVNCGFFLPMNDSIIDHIKMVYGGSNDVDAIVRNRIKYLAQLDTVYVLFYNDTIHVDSFVMESPSAIRHGNGRDWWIHTSNFNLDPTIGRDFMLHYTIDSVVTVKDIETPGCGVGSVFSVFSPDGKWMVRNSAFRTQQLFSVDRCEGQILQVAELDIPENSNISGRGGAFSPNSKYFYANDFDTIWRFNLSLLPEEIASSKSLVGAHDGDWSEIGLGIGFDTIVFRNSFGYSRLGRNGKIYLPNGYCDSRYIHVIHDPNNDNDPQFEFKGTYGPVNGCHFPFNVIELGLFEAEGSPCDTLGVSSGTGKITTSNNADKIDIQVFPNPANDFITVSLTERSIKRVAIYNMYGALVKEQSFPNWTYEARCSTLDLPSGVYKLVAQSSGGYVFSKNVILKH